MNTIDLKARLKNPQFYINLAIGVATIVLGYFGLTGADFTTWSKLFDVLGSAVSNPYVIGMIIVYIYTTIIDTSKPGLGDPESK